MTASTPKEKSKTAFIGAEFDKILMHHVSSLIGTRKDIAALPFNLAAITCLLPVAGRENEIKAFPESPPRSIRPRTLLRRHGRNRTVEAEAPVVDDTVLFTRSTEKLVEKRIRQFEKNLAMPCPVCGTGKVLLKSVSDCHLCLMPILVISVVSLSR